MSKIEKEIKRLKSKPRDYTYDEAKSLLNKLGFLEHNKRKTSGSRVIFINTNINQKIELHKPHPDNIIKMYKVIDLINDLESWRLI